MRTGDLAIPNHYDHLKPILKMVGNKSLYWHDGVFREFNHDKQQSYLIADLVFFVNMFFRIFGSPNIINLLYQLEPIKKKWLSYYRFYVIRRNHEG